MTNWQQSLSILRTLNQHVAYAIAAAHQALARLDTADRATDDEAARLRQVLRNLQHTGSDVDQIIMNYLINEVEDKLPGPVTD